MVNILKDIKAGDLIHFDLITNAVRVLSVKKQNDIVRLEFECASGSWCLNYSLDGRHDNHDPIIAAGSKVIPDAFDIIKVLSSPPRNP